MYTLCTLFVRKEAIIKREGLKAPLSKKSLFVWVFLFPEVALEETGESFFMPGLNRVQFHRQGFANMLQHIGPAGPESKIVVPCLR